MRQPALAGTALVAFLLCSVVAVAAAAQGSPPPTPTGSPRIEAGEVPDTVSDPGTPPVVWLRGPFGRVAGGTLAEPAAEPLRGGPLDLFVKHMPMLLESDVPELLMGVEVVARPLGNPAEEEALARSTQAFTGPGEPGEQLIVASSEVQGHRVERAWLVSVPDRDPPEDGLYDIPAPDIVVSTGSGSRIGVPGDGCYLYLCVETGRPTPPDQLEPLAAAVGETPELSIADGSGLVAWEGGLTPLGRTRGETLTANGAVTDTPTSTVSLSALAPTGRGEWLLEVLVEFDRERGRLRTAYRLVVG